MLSDVGNYSFHCAAFWLNLEVNVFAVKAGNKNLRIFHTQIFTDILTHVFCRSGGEGQHYCIREKMAYRAAAARP